MNIKTVTVIGATGTMGSNVAGIFASFGGANVYVVGRDIDKIKGINIKKLSTVLILIEAVLFLISIIMAVHVYVNHKN